MMLKIFSVYDSKAEAYMRPFYDVAKGAALRAFANIAADSSHVIGQHPADFHIFELGEFDDKSAKFQMLPTPINLGCAIEFAPSVAPKALKTAN